MVEKYLNSLVSCRIRSQIPDYMYLRPRGEEMQDFSSFRAKLEERAAQLEQAEPMQKSAGSD